MSRIAYIPLVDINTLRVEPNPKGEGTSGLLAKQVVPPSQSLEDKGKKKVRPLFFIYGYKNTAWE